MSLLTKFREENPWGVLVLSERGGEIHKYGGGTIVEYEQRRSAIRALREAGYTKEYGYWKNKYRGQ